MHKAFKFRIYPTKEQAALIHKTIGCSRFVFNHFLDSCPYVPVDREKAIGVDLGLKDFAILSGGTKVNAPKLQEIRKRIGTVEFPLPKYAMIRLFFGRFQPVQLWNRNAKMFFDQVGIHF
jgi:transposase